MPDTRSILDRLETATGSSALLDAAIYATIGGAPNTTKAGGRTIPLIKPGDPPTWPAYTASLDAAIALVERCLPGWEWDVGSIHRDFLSDGEHRWIASVASPITWLPPSEESGGMDEPHHDAFWGRAPTPALALLIALFQARLSRGEQRE